MLPDRVSNPGALTCESGALPIALRGPANFVFKRMLFAKLTQVGGFAISSDGYFFLISCNWCNSQTLLVKPDLHAPSQVRHSLQ